MRTVILACLFALSLTSAGAAAARAGQHTTHFTFQSYGKDTLKSGGPKQTGCIPARKVTFDTPKASKRNLPPCPPKS